MHYSILSIGLLAKEWLQVNSTTSPSVRGRIIAIFKNSIYLQIEESDGRCICIGTSALVRGPVNVRTSYTRLPEPGTSWYSKDNTLFVDGLNALDFYAAKIYPQHTNNHSPGYPLHRPQTTQLENLLSPHSIEPAQDGLEQALQSGLDAISEWVEKGTEPIPDEITKLIGCGEGLTPSGDDILIGALITLEHAGKKDTFTTLANWIKKYAPGRTNSISLTHLYAACEGMAVAPLHDFVQAIFKPGADRPGADRPGADRPGADREVKLQQAIAALREYGHRSGLDAAHGVLATVKAG